MINRLKSYFLTIAISLTSTTVTAQDLEAIYQQVLQADPRLLIESLNVGVVVAREKHAFGALLPQVSITSSWTENKQEPEGLSRQSFPGERYTFSVNQPLIDMEKYYSWEQQKDVVRQYEFNEKHSHSLVKQDTIERYFRLLNAQDYLAIIREERAATEKKVQQIKMLYEMQRVKVTEFYEVRARLDMMESKEIDAIQAVDLAKGGLRELTNRPVEYISPLIQTVGFIQPVKDIDEWLKTSIEQNYTLMALRRAIDAAKLNIEKKKAGHYPVLALQLSKQKSDIGYESSSSLPTTTEVAGINLTIPLYTGGRTSALTEEAYKQLGLVQAEYDSEKRLITKELRDSFSGVNAVVRRIEAADKARESAGKSYQAMNRSFELGIATVSEVLDVQKQYSEVKQAYLTAKYEYILLKAKLLHVSGRLNNEAFYNICKWLL